MYFGKINKCLPSNKKNFNVFLCLILFYSSVYIQQLKTNSFRQWLIVVLRLMDGMI